LLRTKNATWPTDADPADEPAGRKTEMFDSLACDAAARAAQAGLAVHPHWFALPLSNLEELE